jgi:dynein heavy chain
LWLISIANVGCDKSFADEKVELKMISNTM